MKIAASALLASACFAQQLPQFEVASVRLSAPDAPRQGPGGMKIQHVSMFELATELGAKMFDRPLIDSTGLQGRYDLRVDLSPVTEVGNDRLDAVAAMITVMHDQLGLSIETGKEAVDVLVIDQANKAPTEN